jgi:hypothetical protein
VAERRTHPNGGTYERGPDGQWHLVASAPQDPINNRFAPPGLQYQVQKQQNDAAASQYAAPRAQAEAALAQAQVPYAGTVAQADATRAQAEAAKAQADLALAQTKAKGKPVEEARAELARIIQQIDGIAADANDNGGWLETGYLGSFNRDRPGSAAFDLQEKLKTIDANSAFAKLSQMRAESPTGGALGNVTEKELEFLKSTIANLNPNQSHAEFLRSLKTARDHYTGMLGRLGGGEAAGIVGDGQFAIGGSGQETVDVETSRQIDAMLRAGRSNDEIIGFAVRKGFTKQPPKPEDLDAWRAYLQSDPGFKGSSTRAIDRKPVEENPVTGFLGIPADSNRGAYFTSAANALTAGTLDEMAGGNAQQSKGLLRDKYAGASLGGDVTGGALSMVGLGGALRGVGGRAAQLATRGGGVGGDMLYGAGFGAGENNDSRAMGALMGAGAAGAGNLAGRGVVNAVGRPLRGIADANVRYLSERGIQLTPGQMLGQGGVLGKGYRAFEDAVGSVPFLGSAIKERKLEGLRDLSREYFKDGLKPINEQVQGVIGQDAIAEGQDLVSNAFGSSLGPVNVRPDMPFVQDAGSAIRAGRRVPEFGQDVDYLVRENLGPAFGANRTLNGEGFQSSLQDIAATAADFRKAGNVRGRNANNAMQDLRKAYFGLANRQAPGATEGLQNANAAHRNISILGDAINSANNPEGLITARQVSRAASQNTAKFGGKAARNRGDVPFRELSDAASAVMPDVVPNSGTADRAWASMILPGVLGGSAIGADQLGASDRTVGMMGGLAALSTKRGTQVAQKLLTSRDPAVRAVGEQILRGRRLGGMFGGSVAIPAFDY